MEMLVYKTVCSEISITTHHVIIEKYDFSIKGSKHIIPLNNHRGRHTEGYHYFITVALYAVDEYAQGDQSAFDEAFRYLAAYITKNPWLPYAKK